MDYREKLQDALVKNEMNQFLKGIYPYNIESSQYSPSTEPTDISKVLSKAVYKEYLENHHIKVIFENTLMDMIEGNTFDIYVTILYIMSELFKEKNNLSPFKLDVKKIISKLNYIIPDIEKAFKNGVSNDEGYTNINVWNDLLRYNQICKDEYGISLFQNNS